MLSSFGCVPFSAEFLYTIFFSWLSRFQWSKTSGHMISILRSIFCCCCWLMLLFLHVCKSSYSIEFYTLYEEKHLHPDIRNKIIVRFILLKRNNKTTNKLGPFWAIFFCWCRLLLQESKQSDWEISWQIL